MDETKVYGWENCPEPVKELINSILKNFVDILSNNLLGFYLHGSLAMGCFNPLISDIDFLAIVKQKLIVKQKKAIIDYLLGLHGKSPVKAVEMSVILEGSVRNFVYPTPFELHYSEGWYERYRNEEVDYSIQRFDEDLAAHFVITKNRGICLFGEPIDELFPEIPEEIYIRSILYDAEAIFQAVEKNPVYSILNLCCILAFLKDKTIVSKKEGGEWALEHLPAIYSPVIKSPLTVYSDNGGEEQVNKNELNKFMKYANSSLSAFLIYTNQLIKTGPL